MNIILFTLCLLLLGTLTSQSSPGESRERDHHSSCTSGRQKESCGTGVGSMNRYENVNQEKYLGNDDEDDDDEDDDDEDDDDEDDDEELLQRSRDGANIGDSKMKRLEREKLEKDGASVGRSRPDGKKNIKTNLRQQKGSKYVKDVYHGKSDSIKNKIKNEKQKPLKEDKENKNMNNKQKPVKENQKNEIKNEKQKPLKEDKENKNKNNKNRPVKEDRKNEIKKDKMKPIKEDIGKVTDASLERKDKRKDKTQNQEYEQKDAVMNSEKGSRMKREGNNLESTEQLGHSKTQGEDDFEYTMDEKESTGTVAEVERNVDGVSDDVNLEKNIAKTERENYVVELDPDSEAIGDTDGQATVNEELGNLSHGNETGTEGTIVELIREVDDREVKEERLKEVESAIEEDPDSTIADSENDANGKILFTEPTTTPRRFERHSPFPEVTLEFDSSTMLPEDLRNGKSDMLENPTDTVNLEFNLSGGRKVEYERTSEHNKDVTSVDASTDVLEDYGNKNYVQSDMTDQNSLHFKSVLENENSGKAENDVNEAQVLENEEKEAASLVKSIQDTEDAKISSEMGSGEIISATE